ncbi:Cytochrome c551 peroxidase [Minicystis rosea]|nr:Cytochrome c551 peroxidase [Minicystis rosea]
MISSLVAAGAASLVSACSNNIPDLPPDQNPVKVATKAPPAISGGTLHVTQQGLAVAADSDRDIVWLVDLNTKAYRKVALKAGDEPGRVAEDSTGHVYVALRGSGALATIDLASGAVTKRTQVCTAPRGVTYDAATDQVHVACATGELVSLSNGNVVRTLRVERDLRDVIVRGDHLLLTRFRSAEVVVIDAADGTVLNRQTPPKQGSKGGFDDSFGTTFTPTVAWRAISLPNGGVAFAHQRSADGTVVISQPDGYGGGGDPCGDGTIVNTTISTVDSDGNVVNSTLPAATLHGATLPVDVATDGNGSFAVASAGSDSVFFTTATQLEQGPFGCGGEGEGEVDPGGQPVAVSFWNNQWVAQTREPAALAVIKNGQVERIELPGDSVADTGHSLFHHAASGTTALACASCHPEGGEDNHTWFFDTIGARRTQTVAGGVLDTAPLHWDGDMDDLGTIMHEVFVNRMGGSPQGPRHIAAFGDWIQTIPAQRFSVAPAADQVERGKEVFFRSDVGCADCHNGAHFTNNRNADVGTGRSVQVPTLVGVATRAPFMHDGCAATLKDRFDPTQAACNGGDKHGITSQLSAVEVDDLIAYLETL